MLGAHVVIRGQDAQEGLGQDVAAGYREMDLVVGANLDFDPLVVGQEGGIVALIIGQKRPGRQKTAVFGLGALGLDDVVHDLGLLGIGRVAHDGQTDPVAGNVFFGQGGQEVLHAHGKHLGPAFAGTAGRTRFLVHVDILGVVGAHHDDHDIGRVLVQEDAQGLAPVVVAGIGQAA